MAKNTQVYEVNIKIYKGWSFKVRMWLAEKLMYVKYRVEK